MNKFFKTSILWSLLWFLTIPSAHAQYDSLPVYGEAFHVEMNVHEDGSVDVFTSADVVFNQSRQGIFVSIPIEYKGYDFSGYTQNAKDKNKHYYFPVSDFHASSHRYETEEVTSRGAVYRLGKAGVYLNGPVRFDYQYKIQMRDLDLSNDAQLFLMNLIGQNWDFPFKEIHYKVNFDKAFGDSLIRLQTSQLEEVTDFKVDGNTIQGVYKNTVGQGNALTILVDVPDDMFVFPNIDYSLHVTVGTVLVAIFLMVLRIRHITVHPIVDSVEFTAPSGLNSAEVAYVYKNAVTSNDVVSLIIYWAHKGFLIIKEHEKDKIELIKVKDISGVSKPEAALFDDLFKERESVYIDDLKNSFYKSINRTISSIQGTFTNHKAKKLYDGKSGTVTFFAFILGTLMAASSMSVGLYKQYGILVEALPGVIAGAVSMVFSGIFGLILYQKIQQKSKVGFVYRLMYFLLGLLPSLTLLVIAGLTDMYYPYTLIMIVMLWVAYFVMTSSYQRSAQGARWFGQILGLKRFIETTEVERLKMFVEETPHIFYDILPYAYVLGLSKVWAKKFETIAIQEPDWYQSTSRTTFNPYLMNRSLSRNMSAMNATMSSVPASQGSSGGGFSGGGGSSGGSFGGGGFGGGGGGSW